MPESIPPGEASAQARDSSASPSTRAATEAEGPATRPTIGVPFAPGDMPLPVIPGYDMVAYLGGGGMGDVYKAYDRQRQQLVALKIMKGLGPGLLLRFKQEFRSSVGLTHPNLVALYELCDRPLWFFTMELVEGAHFLSHVRGPALDTRADDNLTPAEAERLREALGQLVEGVHYLHEAGKLHRDIKPGNVLVTPQGRVVLLDFGLATELDRFQQHQSIHLLGTMLYMAPEQAACRPVSPASDWYAVGVMLYEALTGRLPFDGDPCEVRHQKQHAEPSAPETVCPGVPEDLAALCVELLRRDPAARPAGEEVLRRLARRAESSPSQPPRSSPGLELPLIGREHHLQVLADAFEDTRRGRTVLVDVHGPSGAGKTSLAQRFLDDLCEKAGDNLVILAGRCYEQESVPYKALDSLIDALARYLGRLPAAEVAAVLPRDVLMLARVFPVLRRVEAVSGAVRRPFEAANPQELRRRAFAALRELLARLGDRRPLIAFIDDLQWGDVDSAALLADLLRPPDPPVLLLLGCYRGEDATASPFLQALQAWRAADGAALHWRELAVEALTPAETRDLAARLLARVRLESLTYSSGGQAEQKAAACADAVARESGGNPFFVHELVQYVEAGDGLGGSSSPEDVTLSRVLGARVLRLPEEARRLLEVVAMAGRPVGQAEACEAARLAPEDAHAALTALRAARVVRGTGPADREEIETYHDRIREVVAAGLEPAVRSEHHRRLALALTASGRADPEVLAVHFQAAGEPERAGEYYVTAADRAAEALAFDRAARLYRLALEARPAGDPAAGELRVRLGDALTNAGRGAEAAEAYLTTAEVASVAAALDLRRRAAEQLLRSGHIDRGMAVLHDVLRRMGMRLAVTPGRALVGLLLRRAWLRLRGLRFRPRDPSQVSAEDLARIDACCSVAVGLARVDTIRGADFQARHLLLALRAGEPFRVNRALALEAGYSAGGGGRARRRTARLLEQAGGLTAQLGDPLSEGALLTASGIAAFLQGDWRQSRSVFEHTEAVLRERCMGTAWELDTAQFYALLSLSWLGEWKELAARLPGLLKDVQERGDLYAEINLRTRSATTAWLAAGAADQARREADQAIARWSQHGFHAQHYNHLVGRVQADLYAGAGAGAWRMLTEHWPALERSLLLRAQYVRIEALHLRARSALAAAAAVPASGQAALLAEAEGDARRIERERMAWADPLARTVRAGIAALRRRGDAVALLAEAEKGFAAAGMALHEAAARRRRGELIGGDEGRALTELADRWMTGQDIRKPARITVLLAPG